MGLAFSAAGVAVEALGDGTADEMVFADPCRGKQGALVFYFLCSGLGTDRNHSALTVPYSDAFILGGQNLKFLRLFSDFSVSLPPEGVPTFRAETVM